MEACTNFVKEATVALVVLLLSLYTSITTKERAKVATLKVAYSNTYPITVQDPREPTRYLYFLQGIKIKFCRANVTPVLVSSLTDQKSNCFLLEYSLVGLLQMVDGSYNSLSLFKLNKPAKKSFVKSVTLVMLHKHEHRKELFILA